MKHYYRVFLWHNGQKGTEFTQFLTVPIFIEDRLNEELDTGEIILDNMNIDTKFMFPPKTKIRLERYRTPNFTDVPKTWDMIVEHDDVETYVGLPNKCCHRINLIEPSVIAQGMHVDNIALTYELQDVSLMYKTYNEDPTILGDLTQINNAGSFAPIKEPNNPSDDLIYSSGFGASHQNYDNYFRNSYFYKWINFDSLKSIRLNLGSNEKHQIRFEIPKLICQGCPNGGAFEDLFEINTITRVWRIETSFNSPVGQRELIIEKECGPLTFDNINNSSAFTKDGSHIYEH